MKYLNNSIEITQEQKNFIDRGSWGSGAISVLYALSMKVSGVESVYFAILMVLSWLTRGLFGIPLIILSAINGRKWAWKYRKWKSFDEYQAVQEKWDRAGKIVAALYLLIPLVLILWGFAYSLFEALH